MTAFIELEEMITAISGEEPWDVAAEAAAATALARQAAQKAGLVDLFERSRGNGDPLSGAEEEQLTALEEVQALFETKKRLAARKEVVFKTRRDAADRLFNLAGEGRLELFGVDPRRPESVETIPASYFLLPREVCSYDPNAVSTDAYVIEWGKVRAKRSHFMKVLSAAGDLAQIENRPETPLTQTVKGSSRGGRRRGDGGYAAADAPWIDEMRRLIETDEESSVRAAAKRLWKQAPKGEIKGASEEAAIDRLTRGYRRKYPRKY